MPWLDVDLVIAFLVTGTEESSVLSTLCYQDSAGFPLLSSCSVCVTLPAKA